MNIFQHWQHLSDEHRAHPTSNVVAFVAGVGLFDLRGPDIYRVMPPHPGGKARGWARPATADELRDLDWAAAHNAIQIELRPRTGTHSDRWWGDIYEQMGAKPVEVLVRATGVKGEIYERA